MQTVNHYSRSLGRLIVLLLLGAEAATSLSAGTGHPATARTLSTSPSIATDLSSARPIGCACMRAVCRGRGRSVALSVVKQIHRCTVNADSEPLLSFFLSCTMHDCVNFMHTRISSTRKEAGQNTRANTRGQDATKCSKASMMLQPAK